MENYIKLTILTPEKEFYSGKIVSLTTENDEGRFGILANHVAMISALKETVTIFKEVDGKVLKASTKAGVLRVHNGEVEILCNDCEWMEKIKIN